MKEIALSHNQTGVCDPAKVEDPKLIFRAAGDRTVSYGDGGRSHLIYPIWYCNQPNISSCFYILKAYVSIESEVREELLDSLLKLNEIRRDYQEVTPVEDIIDPDLGPLRIPENFIGRRRAELSRTKELESDLHDFNKDVKKDKIKISEMVKASSFIHGKNLINRFENHIIGFHPYFILIRIVPFLSNHVFTIFHLNSKMQKCTIRSPTSFKACSLCFKSYILALPTLIFK